MKVEILGAGCAKCVTLADKVKSLAESNNIDIEMTKVTDIEEIMDFGVMVTPGLVINGDVKAAGKIPTDDQILAWLKE